MTVSTLGDTPSEPQPSDAERWLELSADDENVSDALHFLSREPDWFDLYKAYEVARSALEGETKMFAQLSKGQSDSTALKKKDQAIHSYSKHCA